jgi:hypothetical protein
VTVCFCDIQKADISPEVALQYSTVRLNMDKKFTLINDENKVGSPPLLKRRSIGCFACGPANLTREMSDLSSKFEFDYHEEVFEL